MGYDTDVAAWAESQAAALRQRSVNALDWDHLAEEIEGVAANQRREIRSRLRVLCMHLLKWQYQPEHRSRSWRTTIATQRDDLGDVLADSPFAASLRCGHAAGSLRSRPRKGRRRDRCREHACRLPLDDRRCPRPRVLARRRRMSGGYDTDILLWSEQQAAALRQQLGLGEPGRGDRELGAQRIARRVVASHPGPPARSEGRGVAVVPRRRALAGRGARASLRCLSAIHALDATAPRHGGAVPRRAPAHAGHDGRHPAAADTCGLPVTLDEMLDEGE